MEGFETVWDVTGTISGRIDEPLESIARLHVEMSVTGADGGGSGFFSTSSDIEQVSTVR